MSQSNEKRPFETITDLPNEHPDYHVFSPDNPVEKTYGETHRGLKSRHVQLIALGGCIGTGLFVGSGAILSHSGPGSLLVAYIIFSALLFFINNALGELCTMYPIRGVSPTMFVSRFADPSTGFATGWNYWYSYAFLVPSEITAGAIVIEYWTHKVPTWVWILILWGVITLLNLSVVKFFGESEFWFASIKIIAICGLIILGVVIFFGGAPTHDRLGFRYWKHDAFKEYIVTGSAGRFCGFWNAMIRSAFSFIMSPELITISAGETQAPRRNVPKATNRFIYRLMFFYVFGSLVIGCIVPATAPNLLSGTGNASASPFVIGIQNAGIPVLNHIINAAILTSAWSSGNSFLFAGSRTLFSLAKDGHAPKIFKYCTKWGVPLPAVLVTSAISLLAFLNVSSSSSNVFTWFTNLSTVSGFLAWLSILSAYIRWRKALQYQGIDDTRPYKTILQPYSSYVVFFFILVLALTNGFQVFVGHSFKASDFIAAYITLPLFVIMYLGHKVYTKNWQLFIPVHEVDVISGLDEAEKTEAMYEDRVPRNFVEKLWFWIA